MNNYVKRETGYIRIMLALFITALILSGATAIPVVQEMGWVMQHIKPTSIFYNWLKTVDDALYSTNEKFPFLLYGYDWLAFGHFVIAISFIGPFMDPVRNKWIIQFGMIACILILPYSLVFCLIRDMPLWWAVIDSSFGVFGIIPLWFCYNKILRMEKVLQEERLNLYF